MNLSECEVCNKPATGWTQNIKQRLPFPDEDPTWVYWVVDGPRHYHCPNHHRQAKVKRFTVNELK